MLKCWPRNCWLQAALLVAASLVILAITSWVSGLSGEVCTANEKSGDPNCNSYDLAYAVLVQGFTWLNDFSVLISAVSAALLTYVTVLLWRLGRESSSITKAQLRAYISASAKQIVLKPDNRTIIVLVEIKNDGQTPAFETSTLGEVKILPKPPYRFGIGVQDPSTLSGTLSAVINPGTLVTSTPRATFTDEDFANIGAGSHVLYVFGRVTFIDTFGDPQHVEFCALLEGDALRDAITRAEASPDRWQVPAGFKVAPFGNDASRLERRNKKRHALWS